MNLNPKQTNNTQKFRNTRCELQGYLDVSNIDISKKNEDEFVDGLARAIVILAKSINYKSNK